MNVGGPGHQRLRLMRFSSRKEWVDCHFQRRFASTLRPVAAGLLSELGNLTNPMKTPCLAVISSVSIALTAYGQSGSQSSPSGPAQPKLYSVVERGPHHQVWESTEAITRPDGKKTSRVHRLTELATGMNYEEGGKWVESKAEIETLPNGAGATASKGQHKVLFPANLNGGVIELNAPDGKWLRSQVLGLSYFDSATGKSVLIAQTKDTAGELHPPNVMVYPDAFDGLKADVRYTYTRAGFEQDIILREQPASPA